MSQNVGVYSGLLEEAKTGRTGAVLALRDFLKNTADKMPESLIVGVSEVILHSMQEQIRQNSRLN